MKESKRDYSKNPNRFTFRLLYNGEPVLTQDYHGNTRETDRDFDSPYFEPFNLSKHIDESIIMDENYPTMHYFQYANIFENSWESVELGEEISEIFRLLLKNGTEQYLYNLHNTDRTIFMGQNMHMKDPNKIIKNKSNPTQEYNKFKDDMSNWYKNSRGNTFTFVIIDKKYPIRNEKGYFHDLRDLNNQIDTLREKSKFNKLTQEERGQLKALEDRYSTFFTEKEIFSCTISADDFSYNDKDFIPPFGLIWKDFNVNFSSQSSDSECECISEFSNIKNKAINYRMHIDRLRDYLTEVEKTGDNIKIASIEVDIRKAERELTKLEKITFKGIRTLIKEYFNKDSYENRFIHPKPKNNNKYTNSCESEIYQESILV